MILDGGFSVVKNDSILIKGARQHNLKNIDVEIPRDKLVVLTGLSGSGKSSLAFDTIYAEGQRRYVESLSSYARQFLGQMDKPDVDYIAGLSPAISIDQKTTSKNPRSTVGTVTEIYDYLRLLYARVGKPHCHKCGREISRQTVQQIVDQVLNMEDGTKIQILGPVIRGKKGEHKKVFEDLKQLGYVRVRVNGEIKDLGEEINLERYKIHNIDVVVDRVVIKADVSTRLAESVEAALKIGEGLAMVVIQDGEEIVFSEKLGCPDCGLSFEELVPRMFSFNNPFGACPVCMGLGFKTEFDPDLVFDYDATLLQAGIRVYAKSSSISDYYYGRISEVCRVKGIDTTIPIKELPKEHFDMIKYGCGEERFNFKYVDSKGNTQIWSARFEGVMRNLERRYKDSGSEQVKEDMETFMSKIECPECKGARLKPESIAVTVAGKSIVEATHLSIKDALDFFRSIEFNQKDSIIAKQIMKEIFDRLGFLINVGLNYLTLDRMAGTLSGGESQRIRLATQIGSSLMGVLYILDEPSIGLHQRDNDKLIATLKELRDLGNTLIVVEHDDEMMRNADHIIDVGPGAGSHGGEIVAQGTIDEVMKVKESITGQYLAGEMSIPIPKERRKPNGKKLVIKGAAENNLKKVNVEIPLGNFVCVTGVSGSGKSSLVNEILYKKLQQKLHRAGTKPGKHDSIEGIEHLDKVIGIDQSPIGRTPRSNPATYTGVFDIIRGVFAEVPESKARGYKQGRFSFNVKGGRCEACRGDGIIKIEMHFLPDVYVPCEICNGKRYNRETLEIKYKGKNISDVLNMRIEEALEFFKNVPQIKRKIQTLYDVGLGYVTLGQPATTLSGGEAQRVKLATELAKRSNGKTLYILDEPTTGLHFADTKKLLDVLCKLVDAKDTVLVIEHNLDVIKVADYIIDMGPEGGDGGGKVIVCGTPEEVTKCKSSYTGQYLKKILK